MAWDDKIPRTHSFSLGDFHDFDNCVFRFFVNHHLGKKYELAEGNPNQTIGSLLDLAIKKLHQSKAYSQPPEYLQNLIKAAEMDMREKVNKNPEPSFFSASIPFLTDEVIGQAKEIFKSYCTGLNGKFKPSLSSKTFWDLVLTGPEPLKLWGGPDTVELGSDGIPEICDYKYRETEDGRQRMDMDLMPKLYTLLCAKDLLSSGYEKARFVVRFWKEPEDSSFYEEFSLSDAQNLADYFKDKMERILRTEELTFCDKEYCKVCNSSKREEWIKELQAKGWIKS